jgi:hypothetical protein
MEDAATLVGHLKSIAMSHDVSDFLNSPVITAFDLLVFQSTDIDSIREKAGNGKGIGKETTAAKNEMNWAGGEDDEETAETLQTLGEWVPTMEDPGMDEFLEQCPLIAAKLRQQKKGRST